MTLPVTQLINNSFDTNPFPSEMKCAEIAPLIKRRIICLRKTIAQLISYQYFQRCLFMIKSMITCRHILTDLGAYRKGHGCSQMLTLAVNSWKWSLDDDKYAGAY